MKLIYLMRHSEAIRQTSDISDFDRPLTEEGQKETILMNNYLVSHYPKPDHVISSNAQRALETTHIITQKFSVKDQLYTGGLREMMDIIFTQDQALEKVMIIAHNPTIHEVAHELSRDSINHFPTSCIVGLLFDSHRWQDIKPHRGSLLFHKTPNLIREHL